MVRLTDLHEVEAENMRVLASEMKPVELAPWITPPSLAEATVAIVSTAGLHRRSDDPFKVGAVDYRLIPGDVDFGELVVSHEDLALAAELVVPPKAKKEVSQEVG